MRRRPNPAWLAIAALFLVAAACTSTRTDSAAGDPARLRHADRPAGPGVLSLDALSAAGERFGSIISVPRFERTPAEVAAAADEAVADADAALDAIAAQPPSSATFESTILALDDAYYPVLTVTNRLYLIKETSTDPAVRRAATEQVERLSNWFTSAQYREDVYAACRAFQQAYEAGRRPRLFGESLRLFTETMRDYRRAGFELDTATRARVEELQKRLTALSTRFNTNITNASVTVYFSEAEMAGAPESLMAQAREQGVTGDSGRRYGIKVTVTPQFVTAMSNLTSEDARRRLKTARYSVAQDENTPILDEMLAVRDEIADLLGYASWADYQTEIKMAGSGARAAGFVRDLTEGLEPKFREELATFAALKRAETGDPSAQVRHWDWRYYENQLKKQRYSIDTEALRVYFPLDRTLQGMFDIFEEIFAIRIEPVRAPWVWFDGVTLHAVSDAQTGEPLGLVYLDLFPREGKYNHFAQFDIIGAKKLPDGRTQRPVCALVCNFTPPRGRTPSLLTHTEVETLFHEFGHAMHTILTRAETARFAGTNVPRDFVEAPSQMLEAWVWDTGVLDRFAADYRDPSKKIDPAVLARMEDAKNATIGVFYRRQLALGTADLRMHDAGRDKSSQAIMNAAWRDVFLPAPEGTNMAAYWGHLTGYDAGYYGYAWADAIAADLETAFHDAPGGLMDREVGRRLRDEIYAPGGSRDIDASIRAFLGRGRTLDAFLEKLGIKR